MCLHCAPNVSSLSSVKFSFAKVVLIFTTHHLKSPYVQKIYSIYQNVSKCVRLNSLSSGLNAHTPLTALGEIAVFIVFCIGEACWHNYCEMYCELLKLTVVNSIT